MFSDISGCASGIVPNCAEKIKRRKSRAGVSPAHRHDTTERMMSNSAQNSQALSPINAAIEPAPRVQPSFSSRTVVDSGLNELAGGFGGFPPLSGAAPGPEDKGVEMIVFRAHDKGRKRAAVSA